VHEVERLGPVDSEVIGHLSRFAPLRACEKIRWV
jgi:hypothetical protein